MASAATPTRPTNRHLGLPCQPGYRVCPVQGSGGATSPSRNQAVPILLCPSETTGKYNRCSTIVASSVGVRRSGPGARGGAPTNGKQRVPGTSVPSLPALGSATSLFSALAECHSRRLEIVFEFVCGLAAVTSSVCLINRGEIETAPESAPAMPPATAVRQSVSFVWSDGSPLFSGGASHFPSPLLNSVP
jgi:hypothetical protein